MGKKKMMPLHLVIILIGICGVTGFLFYFYPYHIKTWREIIAFNCKGTGGEFSNNTCSCPFESEEDLYDKTSGYCLTPDGSVGGEMGAMIDVYESEDISIK